jgi:precorrin-2 dehydrogenase
MLPVVLDVAEARIVLAGQGQAAVRRLRYLDEGGAGNLAIFSPGADSDLRAAAGDRLLTGLPTAADIRGVRLVFVAGLDRETSEGIASAARTAGALVNVEDVIDLCDFHTPALVRRGDLVVSISTGGKSPGLARMFRAYLDEMIAPEWESRLDLLARERAKWYADGLAVPEVSKRTHDLIERNGWLS